MPGHFVITIGRELGSGGRATGKKLEDMLGVTCYDQELLTECAQKNNFSVDFLNSIDEKTPGLFMAAPMVDQAGTNIQYPSAQASIAQFATIREIAERESCIIIGRCADYILADRSDVFNVFLYADMDTRIERIRLLEQCSDRQAKAIILKTDKKRASYYEYYTDKKWGVRTSYDLCLNTSKLSIEGTADIIKHVISTRFM